MHLLEITDNPLTAFLLSPIFHCYGLTFMWGDALGMLTGVCYVYLAARQLSIAWPFSLISLIIYVLILPYAQLPANAALQVVYIFLALYGWYRWYTPPPGLSRQTDVASNAINTTNTSTSYAEGNHEIIAEKIELPSNTNTIPVQQLTYHKKIVSLSAIIVLSCVCFTLFDFWQPHQYSSLMIACADAVLTASSLVFTWLEIGKYVESWIGWIIIDSAYVILYTHQHLYLSSYLSAIYVGFAVYGFTSWRKSV